MIGQLIVLAILLIVILLILSHVLYCCYQDYRNGWYLPQDLMPQIFRLMGIKDKIDEREENENI